MGNAHEKVTLLELCKQLENLPANVHINNNKEIEKIHNKIITKIFEYKTNNKFYSDSDFLEYETVILSTEKENVFYKTNSSGIFEMQCALNSYLNSKIQHKHEIVFRMIEFLINKELRNTAKFCYENNIKYQNFLLYKEDITKTHFYKLYAKIVKIAKENKYEIFSHYLKDSDTIELLVTNSSNNKRLKYCETKYSFGFVVNGEFFNQFSEDFVRTSLQ